MRRPVPDRLLRDLARTPYLPEKFIEAYRGPKKLTPKEIFALECVSYGASVKQAAAIMGCSENSVDSFLRQARAKLRAKNTAGAVASAIRQGLID